MREDRNGLTLLELLVVVVVIGFLAGILLPVFRKAREKTYIGACTSNLRQIGYALQMYAEDHDGQYPPGQNSVAEIQEPGGWTDDLSPLYPGYIDTYDVFMCPAAKVRLPKSEWITSEDQLRHSRTETEIGIDYEYRGRQEPFTEMPTWSRADQMPTKYVLAYDNDNRGENQVIDEADNHGAAGGNKLFSDLSVRWYPADKWGYPWPDGTDWQP